MQKNNPFSIAFGKEPKQLVSRAVSEEEIYDVFDDEDPASQVYIITGVRGYGKTVMMTSVARHYSNKKEWVVINLNPTRDLLVQLAANLYENDKLISLFINSQINLSAFGIGIGTSTQPPISDIEIAIRKLLAKVKKSGKRVLITIDEATNSEYIRVFTSAFQIMIREEQPIFLLMTGLYENIKNLQNDKALTFLYRAPSVELKPLSMAAMEAKYINVFDCSTEEARKLAALTKGYPYAFQVLGYLKWNGMSSWDALLMNFDIYMEERVYEKIWSELSEKDKEILVFLAKQGKAKTADIISQNGHSQSTYSTYRSRLQKRGLIDTTTYGYAELALPRFEIFIQNRIMDCRI